MKYHLRKRGQTYYIRAYVPKHMQLAHRTHSGKGKTEIVRSLGTSDRKVARKRAELESLDIARELYQLPSPEDFPMINSREEHPSAVRTAEQIEDKFGYAIAKKWFDTVAGNVSTDTAPEMYRKLREVRDPIKPNSLAKQIRHQEAFFDWYKNPGGSLENIKQSDGAKFVHHLLEAGISTSTVNDYIGSLSMLWKYMIRHHELNSPNIWASQRVKTKRVNAKVALTEQNCKQLNKNLKGDLRDLWLIMIFTGSRVEEPCNWRVKDITVLNDEITGVHSRVGKTPADSPKFWIPLVDPEVRSIIYERTKDKSKDQYIFDNIYPSKDRRSGNIAKRLANRMKKLLPETKNISAHSCRKTHSTAAENAGLIKEEIARLQNRMTGDLNLDVYSQGPLASRKTELQKQVSATLRDKWLGHTYESKP